MSSITSYKTTAFKESQKFLVIDPSTQSPSLVLGSDLVSYITPMLNYVRADSTRLSAENTDYDVGTLVQTSGATSPGDNFAATYLVVEGGTGDFPMLNGNDLLVIKGDEFLREQLAEDPDADGNGVLLVNGGMIYRDSIAGIEALEATDGLQVSLSGPRSGIFKFDSSDLSTEVTADTQQGVYIAPSSDATGASGAWVRQYRSEIHVSWFGAVGDYDGTTGTDNTAAIQAALDFGQIIKQTGSGTLTVGDKPQVVLDSGSYLVHSTLYIDQFYVDFVGYGFASIIGWTTVGTTEFLLEVGTQVRTANARSDDTKIRNIRFGRHRSNPFDVNYDSTTFGSGSLYQFEDSCAGIKVNRSHAMSIIEDCTFVGLRLGVLLEGAYLFNIKSCEFKYNDRHIQGDNDIVDNVSNNDQVIDGCIFGTSVMNGGVWMSNFDGLRVSNFDFENTHQLPFYFFQCRGLYLEHLYFENNNKFYTSGSLPAYIYSSTPFQTDINDAVASVYAGYNIVLQSCQRVVMRNYLSSNSTVDGLGEVLNAFCQNPVRVEDAKITTIIAPGEYYFAQRTTTESGFDLTAIQCPYSQKLLALDTPARVHGGRVGGNTTLEIPRVWYVDFNTGDDEIKLEDMTALNPLATVNLRAIPEDDARTYEINITGTSATVILTRTHRCGRIKLIGDGTGTTDIGSLQIPTGCNFELSDSTMTTLKRWNDGSHSSSSQGLTQSVGKFDGIVSVFDDAVGFLQEITDSELYFDNCSITQNNAVAYSMIVSTGTEAWFKNHTILNSKRDEARDYGKIYYQASTYTGTAPVVGAARIGKVESL